jgi:hypothetical protein
MNDKQKEVMGVVALIVVGMLVYPPYYYEFGVGGSRMAQFGYNWIIHVGGSLDAATLFMQWIGVLIAGGIAFFILKDK